MRARVASLTLWASLALLPTAGCSSDPCEDAFEKLRGCLTARANCYGLDSYLEATCNVLQLNAEISYEDALDTCKTLMPAFGEDSKICECEGETLTMAEQVNGCGALDPTDCYTCQ